VLPTPNAKRAIAIATINKAYDGSTSRSISRLRDAQRRKADPRSSASSRSAELAGARWTAGAFPALARSRGAFGPRNAASRRANASRTGEFALAEAPSTASTMIAPSTIVL
jgi:hypothetical protein